MVEFNMNWMQSDYISIRKEMRHSFKSCSYISNAFKISLANSFPIVQEKKMTNHFYNNREFWTEVKFKNLKIKFGRSCLLTNSCFGPCVVTEYKNIKKWLKNWKLKGCVHYIFASLFLDLNESTCQIKKNVFYFT